MQQFLAKEGPPRVCINIHVSRSLRNGDLLRGFFQIAIQNWQDRCLQDGGTNDCIQHLQWRTATTCSEDTELGWLFYEGGLKYPARYGREA